MRRLDEIKDVGERKNEGVRKNVKEVEWYWSELKILNSGGSWVILKLVEKDWKIVRILEKKVWGKRGEKMEENGRS
jgi:hypothetical protein